MAMLCLARKKLPHVVFCRRCGCVTFKYANERFLCSQLREGVHSRLTGDRDTTSWNLLSDRDKRLAHTLHAVLSKNAEYEGCVRSRTGRRRGHQALPLRKRKRWHDCVHYFREINGFDAEI